MNRTITTEKARIVVTDKECTIEVEVDPTPASPYGPVTSFTLSPLEASDLADALLDAGVAVTCAEPDAPTLKPGARDAMEEAALEMEEEEVACGSEEICY